MSTRSCSYLLEGENEDMLQMGAVKIESHRRERYEHLDRIGLENVSKLAVAFAAPLRALNPIKESTNLINEM